MNPVTRRAVLIRVAVVGATLIAMLLIAVTRGTGGAEASIDLDRAQHASVAAVMAAVAPATSRVDYRDVVDAETGRAYLEQVAAGFVAAGQAPATGRYEYAHLPASSVAAFHRSLGVVAGEWAESSAEPVHLLLWRTADGTFQAPHSRPGFDAGVSGDTLVVLLDPVSGTETRAIVSYAETAAIRSAGDPVATGTLTVGAD
jgi:hypothetical protein